MTTASPSRVDTVVISTPAQPRGRRHGAAARGHDREGHQARSSPPSCWTRTPSIYINPTGRFVVGGPQGDTGLTGRKIIVDTYGGYARHGGGAFSGKDPTQGGPLRRLRGPLGGQEHRGCRPGQAVRGAGWPTPSAWPSPSRIMVDTFGTGTVADEKIEQAVEKVFDLTPRRHHPRSRPAQAHLPQAGRLRPHGPRGPGREVGEHRPRGRTEGCRGCPVSSEAKKRCTFVHRFFA